MRLLRLAFILLMMLALPLAGRPAACAQIGMSRTVSAVASSAVQGAHRLHRGESTTQHHEEPTQKPGGASCTMTCCQPAIPNTGVITGTVAPASAWVAALPPLPLVNWVEPVPDKPPRT